METIFEFTRFGLFYKRGDVHDEIADVHFVKASMKLRKQSVPPRKQPMTLVLSHEREMRTSRSPRIELVLIFYLFFGIVERLQI